MYRVETYPLVICSLTLIRLLLLLSNNIKNINIMSEEDSNKISITDDSPDKK